VSSIGDGRCVLRHLRQRCDATAPMAAFLAFRRTPFCLARRTVAAASLARLHVLQTEAAHPFGHSTGFAARLLRPRGFAREGGRLPEISRRFSQLAFFFTGPLLGAESGVCTRDCNDKKCTALTEISRASS
jgi:hypothetical protein